jgi:hypothetical protein
MYSASWMLDDRSDMCKASSMSETDRFGDRSGTVCTELSPCLEADQIRTNNKAAPCVGR